MAYASFYRLKGYDDVDVEGKEMDDINARWNALLYTVFTGCLTPLARSGSSTASSGIVSSPYRL